MARVREAREAAQLSAVERLLIRDRCTQQVYKYARLNDLRAWEAVSALFTESGLLYRPG
jgi:hypothetical protein